ATARIQSQPSQRRAVPESFAEHHQLEAWPETAALLSELLVTSPSGHLRAETRVDVAIKPLILVPRRLPPTTFLHKPELLCEAEESWCEERNLRYEAVELELFEVVSNHLLEKLFPTSIAAIPKTKMRRRFIPRLDVGQVKDANIIDFPKQACRLEGIWPCLGYEVTDEGFEVSAMLIVEQNLKLSQTIIQGPQLLEREVTAPYMTNNRTFRFDTFDAKNNLVLFHSCNRVAHISPSPSFQITMNPIGVTSSPCSSSSTPSSNSPSNNEPRILSWNSSPLLSILS